MSEWKEKIRNGYDNFKYEAKQKVANGMDWVMLHKTEIVIMTPIAVSAFGALGKGVKCKQKQMEIKHEQRKRDLQIYDPSTGCYLYLRRPLRTDEKVKLANRTYGTTVTQCLDELNVLK